ncbi:tetraspanin-18-like [Ostrinia nubilalis]|uniref:tetraspanin-18-like n=1 Tax=Ostrinia nubilalis TaxID=29057 RepID=UPI0030823A19
MLSFLLTLGLYLVVKDILGCIGALREHVRILYVSALSRGVLSFLLTLGLYLVVTAILGCIGALREHVRILYVHACFFIFLVSIEVVVGVGGAVLSAWVGGGSELRHQFFRNLTIEDELSTHQAFWDPLQSENQCCGVDGPQDYAILHREIPPSCCARAHPLRDGGARRQIHAACLTDKTYYDRGCEEALRQKKALKGNIFISTGIIFALLELALCEIVQKIYYLLLTIYSSLGLSFQAPKHPNAAMTMISTPIAISNASVSWPVMSCPAKSLIMVRSTHAVAMITMPKIWGWGKST